MGIFKNLADTIIRKFTNTFPVEDWEIKTDKGWSPVISVSETVPYEIWTVTTRSGKMLQCADDHIIFDESGNQIFAKDCIPYKTKILTEDGVEQVIYVRRSGYYDNMYDLEVDSEDHRFYSNGVLSHNSTTTCAFLLHTVLFKDNQRVAILANKGATARKLLDDLQKMYMSLPKWIQQGVVEFNKGSMTLENGSKIVTSGTSADAIRGSTFNIIFLDEFAFVPTHLAEEFFASVFPTISSGKTTKVLIVSTPHGHNHYYKMWTEAHNPRDSDDPAFLWNGYVPFGISWKDVPGRDEKWRQETIAQQGEERFRQEFECLGGNTQITVKDKETGEIFPISMNSLYELFEKESESGKIVLP